MLLLLLVQPTSHLPKVLVRILLHKRTKVAQWLEYMALEYRINVRPTSVCVYFVLCIFAFVVLLYSCFTYPPIRRTRRGTTSTKNTLVHAIELGTILARLQILGLARFLWFGWLQPRFNGTVLFVKIGHVGDQIFEHKHVWQGINLGGFGCIFLINIGQTSQSIDPINIHGTRTANAFATRTTKGQGWILLVFNLDESIQYHGTAFIQINRISRKIGALILFRIPTIDLEILDAFWFVGRRCRGCDLERAHGTHALFGKLCLDDDDDDDNNEQQQKEEKEEEEEVVVHDCLSGGIITLLQRDIAADPFSSAHETNNNAKPRGGNNNKKDSLPRCCCCRVGLCLCAKLSTTL